MAWRRVAYALILLAAAAAFIVTDSGISLFVLVCLLVLPVITLVTLIVARYRVKLDFTARESCIRGGAIQLDIKVGVSPRFLAGLVKVAADIENSTFGKTERTHFTFNDLSYTPHTYEFISSDSGRICVRIKNVKLVDIFGLFALSVKSQKFAESFVSPMLYDDIRVRVGESGGGAFSGETPVPRRGQDSTEIFDIRDYAPGDSLKSVHWKLSGKFDALKTKEFGSTDDHKTLVLVDFSRNSGGVVATDEQLNAVLDVAVSVSNALETTGYAHSVGWFNDGEFYGSEVLDNETFVQMVNKLMSIKVMDGNAEVLFYLARAAECAAFNKVILVAPCINVDDIKNYGGGEITAVVVGTADEQTKAHGINIIEIPIDNVHAALADCVL